MKHRIIFAFLLALSGWSIAVAQSGVIEGNIIDDLGDPVSFANVALYQGQDLIRGVQSDLDGKYIIGNLDPGTYDVEVSFVGLQTKRQNGVIVSTGIVRVNFDMSAGIDLETIEVVDYKVPLIQTDKTTSGGIVTGEQIENLPIRNVIGIAATTAGVSAQGGNVNIKGSRSNATVYFLNGVRIDSRDLPPETEIEQIEVITGGISAKYGDVTGGVISITTKKASAKFRGGLEVETGALTDPYGYNLFRGNLSGPLLRKDGKSIVGFRISGNYRSRVDDNPSAVGVYRLPEEEIRKFEANPDSIIGITPVPRVEYMDPSLVQLMTVRPNEQDRRMDFTGNLNTKLGDNVDIDISGMYSNLNDRFSPSSGYFGGGFWALLNHPNNPEFNRTRYRGNFRFRHRLGTQGFSDDNETKGSLVENVSYSIQFGYENSQSGVQDIRHKDNLFNYGYIGKFTNEWEPFIGLITDSTQFDLGQRIINPNTGQEEYWGHIGYTRRLTDYQGSDINPGLSNQNNYLEGEVLDQFNQYPWFNGARESDLTRPWFGIFNNVGSVYNRYTKNRFDRYTANINTTLDIFPGKDRSSRHSLEFGFNYEQRIRRSYRVSPQRLWDIMRLQGNAVLNFVDSTKVLGTQRFSPIPNDTTNYTFTIYAPGIVQSSVESNISFWRNARDKFGVGDQEYLDTDALDPSQLSIDMFSASELTDQNIVGYFGYDYTGQLVGTDVTFNDFFTQRNAAGKRTFAVAPFTPIYWSAYFQDKFSFQDVIVQAGVSVERYDANTKVLKDPMSLYSIQNARDFYAELGEERPSGVEDEYLVYVSKEDGTDVVGFRKGNSWFDENGQPVNSPAQIFKGNIVRAKLANPESNIQLDDYNPDESFEDYVPQINIAPRISLSFPISDEANFFAHYDVRVQRPTFNQIAASPLQYYYFLRNANLIANPNLRPETTVDYEVGFKQKISNSAAITLSAYYREQRNMIQLRTIKNLPLSENNIVSQYTTYDNIDFGTTKGFTFQLDMRRKNNLQGTINYTLGFADGTGSDPNSASGLTQNEVIRTLNPLSFDERHNLNIIMDYRYSSGNKYDGPRLFGADVFADAGINIQTNVISGRPYTRSVDPTPLPRIGGEGIRGVLNGSRKPWIVSLDGRLDKDFKLSKSDAKNRLGLNVYLRVTNILNTRNVLNVYDATGSPDDDGFLSFAEGQLRIRDFGEDERARQSYLNAYQWGVLRPGFFTMPRRIFLGARFTF